MLLSLRQNPFLTLQKSRGVSVTRVFCDHSCFSSMAMGAMAALHGLAWCLGSLQKLPQSCRAVRTGLKDNPLCYCEARMWLIAIRIHIFPPCVKSLYVSYNHHFWASSQPQNRFSFTISGSHLANIPMKVESSKSTPFSRHVVILLFCTKHGSWSVLSRGITYGTAIIGVATAALITIFKKRLSHRCTTVPNRNPAGSTLLMHHRRSCPHHLHPFLL